MKAKRTFPSELAYAVGLILLAVGTALMEKADLGMSMVVAPAYLLYLKLSQIFPAFSFGMAEYLFQALLLVVLSIVLHRARISCLFSFVTAVVYGLILDLAMRWTAALSADTLALRLLCFLGGLVMCGGGVALLFHTYIAPEAYELFVKEISGKYGWRIDRVKTVYDCASCLLGIVLSFLFFGFGRFEGVKLGTVFCALVNGWLIGRFGALLERAFQFRDALPLRSLFNR